MVQPFHEQFGFFRVSSETSKLRQPFTESGVQSLALGASNKSCLLNQIFVRAQCNIFHTNIVYTIIV